MQAEKPAGAPDELTALENTVVDHLFALQPGFAVFLGLHRYDGQLPDYSRAFTDGWVETARSLAARVQAVAESSLSPERRLDRFLLELLLEGTVFDLTESRDLDRNPMSFVGPIALTPYMVREYAPVPVRVDAIVRTLEAVPKLLTEAPRRLDAALPEPFIKLSLQMASGLPAHFQEGETFARATSSALADRVASARGPAEAAVKAFTERLTSESLPKATGDFALGGEKFQRLLWVREGLKTPYAEVLEKGWADLRRNQARLLVIAHAESPPTEVTPLLERLYRDHSTAEGLIPEAQGFVAEARAFVADRGFVTIPTPDVCRVQETPPFGRALYTASMNPPGPFDVAGDDGIYYVTPVDPTWSKERQEEWLRSLNRTMLKNITIHEAYPGHYLQFLHVRRHAKTTARKVYFSASFTEGWAHYCEQLAIEEGFGRGTVQAEVAQIHDALLRDCRLIASIGLHTQNMTVAQATELFKKEAHFETLPAEREAIRGTFNPEYFCYTLGKLAILDARSEHLLPTFAGSLKAFHDRLLSFGSPPIGMIGALLAAH